MTFLSWILFFICAAGCHLSSASPVLRSALVVRAEQNVSLSCNLTSQGEIIWYFLRSEELLPLLTVISGKMGVDAVSIHPEFPRVGHSGRLEDGSVSLEVLQVEEQDAGLYFCTGKCAGAVCVDRGIHVVVDGADRDSSRLPCWSLGICILPAFLVLCLVFMVGFYLCSVFSYA
ncbi:hypothetical protein L3Q82_003237 [Scortum barcoo]|uniref:Uncharacterized protein n=1 Tax=Scortum barcoo TaxID=214431 RepID=A0ACB8VUM8_9TELE|nr:hypothetical protein L3Q82_003237 [Scortum barcoo]